MPKLIEDFEAIRSVHQVKTLFKLIFFSFKISGLQNFQAIDIGNCNHLEKREEPILNFCITKFLQNYRH